MRVSIKGKTYGLCNSCRTCEFYGLYSNGIWCEFPFGETHYLGNTRIRPIYQDDIFKL
jgi:hypothetical protein